MVGKLQGNGLWESSRMILPEHKEAYIQHQERRKIRPRPALDEDLIAEIDQAIAMSLHNKAEITLTLYGTVEDRRLTGYVVRVDQGRRRVLVQSADGDEWIQLEDIIGVTTD